jgi:hypothetical protein
MRRSIGLASVAGGIMGRLDTDGSGRERARAISAWRQVAGDGVFAHARGFALREGELLVFVDTPVWAQELAALAEIYRTGINERLGKEVVGSIRFAVSRKVEEASRFDQEDAYAEEVRSADAVEPVPLTEEEREAVEAMAGVVANDDLRKSVTAAAIAHFEWRKGIEARNAAQKAIQRAREGSEEPQP